MWALVKEGTVVRIFRQPQAFRDNRNKTHFKDVFTRWSAEELAAIDVYPVEEIDEAPAYSVKTGTKTTFDGTKVTLEVTYEQMPLETIKKMTLKRINRWKQRQQDGMFEYGGNTYQCDPRSRDFIMGRSLDAFIALSLQQEYTVTFRDADNVDHELTAQEMIELGKAAADHVQHYHDTAKALKDTVAEAQSFEDLATVLDTIKGSA